VSNQYVVFRTGLTQLSQAVTSPKGERLSEIEAFLADLAKPLIKVSQNGYVIFDDTVIDKRYSEEIELARRNMSLQMT